MRTTRFTWLFVLMLALAAVACRGGGDGDGDGDGDTIQEVQAETMPVDTIVNVFGVVVTAVDDFGGRTGGIYVQEPEGGEFSGVFVFLPAGVSNGLAPGDVVDVLGGKKEEFALTDDMTGKTLTEISPPDVGMITVNKTGTGTIPTPPVLLPQDLAGDANFDEAEKWEGVPITFENVRVFNNLRTIGMETNQLKETVVTGPFPVQSGLTSLDALAAGECLASVTGIGDYFFNYKIQPRSAADIVTGGAGCLAVEETAATCDDDVDNDLNGFADCSDFNCTTSEEAGVRDLCTTAATIPEIRNGTFDPDTGLAEVTGAVVTAVRISGTDPVTSRVWLQDGAGAALFGGIMIFHRDDAALPVAVGDVITVTGRTGAFFDVEQLTDVTVAVTGTQTPIAHVAPVDDVRDNGATGDMWESQLVTVTADVVDADSAGGGISIGAVGAELAVSDFLFSTFGGATFTAGASVAITGVTHRFSDAPTLNPRDAGDLN